MEIANFKATCPYQVGDAICVTKGKPENGVSAVILTQSVITDIVAVHSVKKKTVTFKYELNNSGQYIEL